MPEFKFRDKVYNNPVELALEVLGGKWKMPILWRVKDKPWRYGELKKSLGKITHKMLTQQLRELEEDGLIHREVFAEVPPRVEYTITEEGETVIPIIKALQKWGYDFMNKQ